METLLIKIDIWSIIKHPKMINFTSDASILDADVIRTRYLTVIVTFKSHT